MQLSQTRKFLKKYPSQRVEQALELLESSPSGDMRGLFSSREWYLLRSVVSRDIEPGQSGTLSRSMEGLAVILEANGFGRDLSTLSDIEEAISLFSSEYDKLLSLEEGERQVLITYRQMVFDFEFSDMFNDVLKFIRKFILIFQSLLFKTFFIPFLDLVFLIFPNKEKTQFINIFYSVLFMSGFT